MKEIQITKRPSNTTLEVYGPTDWPPELEHGDSIAIRQRNVMNVACIVLFRRQALALAKHILRECGEKGNKQ